MAQKEASVYIINLDDSMAAKRQMALKTVSRLLYKKILGGRKGDQVDILLTGTAETCNMCYNEGEDSYQNVWSFCHSKQTDAPMIMPSIEMLRLLERAEQLPKSEADVVDGIIVAIQTIIAHTKHYKYQKSILLFTDASKPIDDSGIDDIKQELSNQGITLRIWYFISNPAVTVWTILPMPKRKEHYFSFWGRPIYCWTAKPLTRICSNLLQRKSTQYRLFEVI